MCCNLQNVILANVKHVCDVQIKPDSVTMSSKCDSAVRNEKTLHFHLEFFITLPNARSSLSHVNERGNSTNSNTVTVTPTGNCPLGGDNLMNAQQYYYC